MKKYAKKVLLALSLAVCLSMAIPQTAEAGTWKSSSTGWWYREDNGTWPRNQWKKIGGKWYHFNKSGYMNHGWFKYCGYWYYLGKSTDGSMKTGWQKVDGNWYYLDSEGRMLMGWQSIKGHWYYMNQDGVMLTGWKQLSGSWYYFSKYGAMQTGWKQIGSNWYYLNSNGKMQIGWKKISSKWYYMASNGVMQTGWKQIAGKWYYLYSNGSMAASTYIGSYYVDANGVWTSTVSSLTNVVDVAKTKLGSDYVWGATGQIDKYGRPSFDCSGFVWWVFDQCGYRLTRQSSMNMSSYGKEITMAQAKPGSVLFYGASKTSIGHIAIYMGNNQVIECGGGGANNPASNPGTIANGNVGVRILTTAQLGPAVMVRDWSSLPRK